MFFNYNLHTPYNSIDLVLVTSTYHIWASVFCGSPVCTSICLASTPVRKPLRCLSCVLNCWVNLSFWFCGTAQSPSAAPALEQTQNTCKPDLHIIYLISHEKRSGKARMLCYSLSCIACYVIILSGVWKLAQFLFCHSWTYRYLFWHLKAPYVIIEHRLTYMYITMYCICKACKMCKPLLPKYVIYEEKLCNNFS